MRWQQPEMMRHLSGWLLLLLLLPLGSGCGFQLRGSATLPPELKQLALQGVASDSPLAEALRLEMAGRGGVLLTDPTAAPLTLVIVGEAIQRRVLSVDSAGRASEYELSHQIRFLLQDQAGKRRLSADQVTLYRSYRFDPDDILGKSQEEALLQHELRQLVVQQMLSQLRARLMASE